MKANKYASLDEFFADTERPHQWLADQLGVDKSYISLLRSGERQPSLPVALQIEEITGVPVEALVRAS